MNKKYLILTLYLFVNACTIFTNKNTAGTFPIYGNYCGLDHPRAGSNPIPIDKTDLACKNHDKCYDQNEYFNKKCDENIVTELKSIKPKNEIEKIARDAIVKYFEISTKI
jgi:hypothetical protein